MNRNKFFLFDDKYTDTKTGFEIQIRRPEITGMPLLVADRPWERLGLSGDSCLTILEEDGIYKMWYGITSPEPDSGSKRELNDEERVSLDLSDVPRKFIADILCPSRYFLCYAVSRDGLHWEKPNLGIYEVDGNKNNNIVWGGRIGATVFIDPTAKPDARYKMIHGGSLRLPHWMKQGNRFIRMAYTGIYGASSPDGIHWRGTPKPIMPWYTDTTNVCYWDDAIDKYVAYVRTDKDMIYDNGKTVMLGAGHRTYRIIARSESADFENFPAPENILEPHPEEVEDYFQGEGCKRGLDFYNSSAIKYPFAPETYLMFPSYFNHEADNVEIHLATSRDGVNYSRHDQPLIGLSELGDFHARQLYMGVGMVADGNRIHMYILAGDVGHDEEDLSRRGRKAVARVSFRRDGFIGQHAQNEGEYITIPLHLPQYVRNIRINAVTAPDGWVRCAILAGDGKIIPGMTLPDADPVCGDCDNTVISWQGRQELSALAGSEIKLRFQARAATVFSLEFV